ncbi:MAG: DUF4292 domain-containing protein, partial [Pseudobdellovibrio sp.]
MNKEKLSLIIVFSCLSVINFSGCVSEPIKPIGENQAVIIDTKAQIKNNGESNNVKIEIALLPKKAIRLEITATLGVSVATVLMTSNQISYALHTTKQFVIGPFHEKTLYPVFKNNIDPRWLWRIINAQTMTNINLTCSLNADSKPVLCSSIDGSTIKWTYEDYPRKRIDIVSNRFEMSWLFRDISPLNETQN